MRNKFKPILPNGTIGTPQSWDRVVTQAEKDYIEAGITKTPATKSLPATFGLPDALAKFGLNLKTKEEKLSSLEDTIRKDIEEEESKGTN